MRDHESGTSSEVRSLREYVETKFEVVHDLVERVTKSLEKLNESNNRIVALEAKQEVHQQFTEKRLAQLEVEQRAMGKTIAKLVFVAAAVSSLAGILVTWLANNIAGFLQNSGQAL